MPQAAVAVRAISRPARGRRHFQPLLEPLEERLTPDVSLNLVLPPTSTYGVTSSLVIEYTNTGSTAEAAPLLVVSADKADLWLPTDPTVRGPSLQVLATAPTGPADTLAPGAHGTIVVNFTGTTAQNNVPIHVTLNRLAPGQALSWASLKTGLRPKHIPADAWDAVFANFTANVGSTTDSYQAALGRDAAYLGQLGEPIHNVARLIAYEINKANNGFSTPSLGRTVDAALPTPGPALSVARWFQPTIAGHYRLGTLGRGWVSNWDITAAADNDGNVTITAGGALRTFLREADGSYLPTLGDHGTLTRLANGGFQVQELGGDVTVFNANGTLNYVQDTNGNRITATFTSGRLTKLTASNGSFVTFSYTNGLLTAVTDSTGRSTTYGYDAAGQHLLSSTNEWGTTTYQYVTGQGAPAEHALASIAFADNTHVHFSYDARGRLIGQHRDNNQEAVSVGYPPVGGYTLTNALGAQTSVLTDDSGQVRKVINAQGEVAQITFNPSGDLTAVSGPLGTQATFTYDLDGNLTSATDPLGLTTHFTYDTAGRLLSYKDARSNTTNYQYDTRGNLLSIRYPNNSLEQFQYDPAGNQTRATNARGRAINYTSNAAGQVLEAVYQDGSRETYTYSTRGQLLTAANATGTITFRYQNASNPNLVTQIDYPNGQFLRFQYNAVGQRTQSVDQTGFTINYSYDAVGRLHKLTDGSGSLIVQYTYDAAGQLIQKDLGNGTRTIYQYDAIGNLLQLVNLASNHATINSRFDYTYDARGRVTSMSTGGVTTVYGYDAAGQLTAIDTTGLSIRYTYDAAGNRLTETVNGTTKSYTANSMNQYTAVGGTTYQYDADGNLISRTDITGTTTYAYSDENRLIGINGPGLSAAYTYDPLGHRQGETVNGTTTRFLIDPIGLGDVVAEYTNGDLVAHYAHGFDLTSRVAASGSAAYYDFDRIGNTAGMTSASGTYVNRYSYLPFGQTTTVAAALPNRYTFVGAFGVMTDGGGTSSMRLRNYDAATGQFLSKDPLGLAAGDTNLRRYVANNPVSFNDPSGLAKNPFGPPFGPGNPFKDRGKPSNQQGQGKGTQAPSPHVMDEINKGRAQGLGKPDHTPNGSEELPNVEIGNARIIHNYVLEGLGLGNQTISTIETIAGGGFVVVSGALGAEAVGGGILWLGNVLRGSLGTIKAAIAAAPLTAALPVLANPMDSGTTNNRMPETADPKLIEGFPATLIVGNLIWGGTPPPPSAFTAQTVWDDGVTTQDIVAEPGAYPDASGVTTPGATYVAYAMRVFPETGRPSGVTTIQGPNNTRWTQNIAPLVYDAPWIVNPVNFTVPVGGVYHGPIATFRDLNPYGNPAHYSAGWVQSSTLIPAQIVGGGGSYTVIAELDFSHITWAGNLNLLVRVWDRGPGPNPKGGADVLDIVTLVNPGTPLVTTSVQGQIIHTNKKSGDPPLAIIDTTAPNLTSIDQVGVWVETPSDPTIPVPLITGMSMTRLGEITRIVVEGVASAVQPGAGLVFAAPLTITLPGQAPFTTQLAVNQSFSEYTLNATSVVAVHGQPLQNVPVALLEGPADGSYSATIDWGDGEVTPGQVTALGGGVFRVSGSKPQPYASAGTRIILVNASGPGLIPASPVQVTATITPPSVTPSPVPGGGRAPSPTPPASPPPPPRGIKARLVALKVKKRSRLMVEVFFADSGTLKSRFLSPYRPETHTNIRVSARDGNGDGAPDQVVVTARKGKKTLTAIFLG